MDCSFSKDVVMCAYNLNNARYKKLIVYAIAVKQSKAYIYSMKTFV